MWCFDGAARDALVRVAATAAEKKVRLEVARGWAATSSPGEEEARMVTATRRDADRLRVAEAPEIAAGMVEDIVDIGWRRRCGAFSRVPHRHRCSQLARGLRDHKILVNHRRCAVCVRRKNSRRDPAQQARGVPSKFRHNRDTRQRAGRRRRP